MDYRQHDIVRVRSLPTKGRRPKAVAAERTCSDLECSTVLTRYNQAEQCYLHLEPRYPRIRGGGTIPTA